MRRKSSGVAVVALLVGVAVAVTLYIASYGKSSHHADAGNAPAQASAASDSAFALAPLRAASDAVSSESDQTAAR